MLTSRLVTCAAALALVAGSLGVASARLATPGIAGATTPTAPTSDVTPVLPIGHVGRWLTDADGRVVLLHGVNFVSKTPGATPASDGFGDDDATWLADNGFDVVRLGTTAASIMPTPGVIDTAYVNSFAATVHDLTSHGLLVLIDLHQDGWSPTLGSDGFPDWMTLTRGATNTHTDFPLYYVTNPAIQAAFQSFWDNDAGPGGDPLQTSVGQIWSALSGAVASDPGVIGYDLFNEPWPGTTFAACATDPAGCPVQDAALDAFNARMDTDIRANDSTHLVFGEPYVLFNFGMSPTNISLPGSDPNSGMAWHMYTLDPTLEPAVINYAKQWSAQTGGALFNTEFGAVTDVPSVNRMVGELDDALMPWIWWAYNEGIMSNMSVSPTNSTINLPITGALVRPHPVAVAGTPTANHFDPTTDMLTFSYSATKASGGSFACGTVTSFQVPQRSYPNGYHVNVTGGVVTSAAGSQHLTVVASPGASTVDVTVAAGGTTSPTPISEVCPVTVPTNPPTTTTTPPQPTTTNPPTTTTPPQPTTTTTAPPQPTTPNSVKPVAAPATAVKGEPTFTG